MRWLRRRVSLIASSLRIAADPEYLPRKGKVKLQRVKKEFRSHGTS
jgi:hypothetical protein